MSGAFTPWAGRWKARGSVGRGTPLLDLSEHGQETCGISQQQWVNLPDALDVGLNFRPVQFDAISVAEEVTEAA